MDRSDKSTLGKMQQKYWITKHALVYKKLGIKQEDQCIVASDSDLDLKLELYHAIQESCDDLLRIIENYQDRICSLAHEENAMGRFLKEHGKIDKTRAGKMMSAVGKTMSYTAQQRLSLRVPLVRLYQEVETFRNRAIVDCAITVNKMEASRTSYRGALLWMKDVSQELDPDTFKRLEKFRKVQAQVKKTKVQFDKLKLDTCQKIDLLSASRCNMFSRILATYENTLVQFWEKTARTLTHVSECFRGYQHYEFAMLKELTEPSKKLAEETSKGKSENTSIPPADEKDKDQSLFFDGEYHDETGLTPKKEPQKVISSPERSDSLINLMDASMKMNDDALIDVTEQKIEDLVSNGTIDKVPEKMLLSSISNNSNFCSDLLTNNPEIDDIDKDDLTLLNEILDIPTSTNSETLAANPSNFSQQWLSSFGSGEQTSTPDTTTNSNSPLASLEASNEFMPSHLLDLQSDFANMELNDSSLPSVPASVVDGTKSKEAKPGKPTAENGLRAKPKKDMSAWYDLFADLDPLANPDAVGQSDDVKMNEQRNC